MYTPVCMCTHGGASVTCTPVCRICDVLYVCLRTVTCTLCVFTHAFFLLFRFGFLAMREAVHQSSGAKPKTPQHKKHKDIVVEGIFPWRCKRFV